MLRSIVLVLTLLYGCILPAHADQLFLRNGDRLTGTLQQLVDGKLMFKSDLAGVVTVQVENVQTLTTNAPVVLKLQDGSQVQAQVSASEAGRLMLNPGTILQAQAVQLTDVVAINPPLPEPPRWKGNLRAGYAISGGNSETEEANVGVDLSRRGVGDRITFAGAYLFGREKNDDTGDHNTTKDEWFAALKYDYFIKPQFYIYGNTRIEQDHIANLDLRLLAGSGVGYQWFETAAFNLFTEAGPGWKFEVFEDDENNQQVSLRLAYHIDRRLNRRLSVFHATEFYPSMKDFSDYYLTSQAGLHVSLTTSLFAETRAVIKHDSTPAEDAEQTDFTYLLSVGWNF